MSSKIPDLMRVGEKMERESFKIYVDQLEGVESAIKSSISAQELDLEDRELKIAAPIEVSGCSYIAGSELVIQIDIATKIAIPCRICNEWVTLPLEIEDCYLTTSLEEIKGGFFILTNSLERLFYLKFRPIQSVKGPVPGATSYRAISRERVPKGMRGGDGSGFPKKRGI